VFALDLLGFGRSSRPTFRADISFDDALCVCVESVERWRKVCRPLTALALCRLHGYLARGACGAAAKSSGLLQCRCGASVVFQATLGEQRIVLAGHSFGGYIVRSTPTGIP
jgi:pimeloyl-ACP methyl ester carboxylesterase